MPIHAMLFLAPLIVVMWVLVFALIFTIVDEIVEGKLTDLLKRRFK